MFRYDLTPEIRTGIKVTNTIPKIISEKCCFTKGILPKRKPEPVAITDQDNAAMKARLINTFGGS